MDPLFSLPEEYVALRESVRALADKKIQPFAHDVDANARFPQEALDALQAAGLAAPHVPVEFGGEGADSLGVVIVIEEVARVCASSSLIPAVNKLGSVPLMLGGNESQKERWLTQLAKGKGFSYCLSESEAGSDAAAMKTRAVKKGDGWVLNGSKKWISHAGVSEFYTVLASTDPEKGAKGITAFVIEKSDSGVSFGAPEKKMGFKGSPTREVYFDNVEIGDDRRISEIGGGFGLAMKTLDHTRITIAAQALGIAQGAFEVATKYAKERRQFGKPIFDFQAVQFMLADMAMEIEAARQLTYAAAVKSERGERDLTFFSAASKCFATDVAMKVTTDAVQVLGGYGYVNDYPVERMMRDAKLTQIYEGTNQIQRLVMARNLGVN
ncbi:MAG: acyl-CoA dehydrogenase family protein [Candidatus Nanopelagicaceae bacterium]|jgi:alkylation response protein AidB-like acyl-CoA dehydrogenase|nr:acyl-CoA dehydrogenase [Actinomycetota bacterium]NCV83076.1 acyl-CoA dehydrogenase [Actinomycetota bacterium]NCV95647.1 acyl-CoA dehydrogenase [Actinomycetota bacterium]NCW46822.1 acyl-CoA dehydrogenase [Actinomycetota bacterium]NCW75174.1 acyl-CoA dehydrogenase [Actinomycetota bacterium]